MTRTLPLALLAFLVCWLARPALGQQPEATAPPPPPEGVRAPSGPLAGMIVGGAADGARPADALARAIGELEGFASFNDAGSVASLARVLVEAAWLPGARLAVLDAGPKIEGGGGLTLAASVPAAGAEPDQTEDQAKDKTDDQADAPDRWRDGGRVYMLVGDGADRNAARAALAGLEEAFAPLGRAVDRDGDGDGDGDGEDDPGVSLMLDLEGLRRAWPEALAEGPARRVLAVSGLANARTILAHLPGRGAVRLAYTSRAEPPERVHTRDGPAHEAMVGARWPRIIDAALRAYGAGLGPEGGREFAQSFRAWMEPNGGRLRAVLGAAGEGVAWSVAPDARGLVVPVRDGVPAERLVEVALPLGAALGMERSDGGWTLSLPAAMARALGGSTLRVAITQDADGGAVFELRVRP